LTERYLFGAGVVTGAVVDEILARTSSGGTTAWYLTDNLGSVRDIVNTSGNELDHIVYDSFGNIVTETNATNRDRFKFAGMEWDAAIGQYYDHARYYGSSAGRFETQDPTGFAAGDTNLYRYVANSPVDSLDRSGLQEPGYGMVPLPGRFITDFPTAPTGKWTPTQFFGSGSPLIYLTGWGCGGMAAWRAGVPLVPTTWSGRKGYYDPWDIPDIPGTQKFATFNEAQAALKALGGKGLIILVDNPKPDWKDGPGSGNFATYWPAEECWEWANHGDSMPGRLIKHSPTMPDYFKYKTYYVVPTSVVPRL
jgi:RHS repeat-associated protein